MSNKGTGRPTDTFHSNIIPHRPSEVKRDSTTKTQSHCDQQVRQIPIPDGMKICLRKMTWVLKRGKKY
jgi:hypothetical protein